MCNLIKISGTVATGFTLDHEFMDEKYYRFDVVTHRESGATDTVNVIASEYLIDVNADMIGKRMDIVGQLRTFNVKRNNHTFTYVFPMDITTENPSDQDLNEVTIKGTICKKRHIRSTPNGRVITDFIVAVPRYRKTDYVYCIAWGRNASIVHHMETGEEIEVTGRMQSRSYEKNGEPLLANEVSVTTIGGLSK